jgi:Tol biopolymer transport system component
MDQLGRDLFAALLTELIFVMLAILLRDDKRRVAVVLAIGTLIAGIIGFGPQMIGIVKLDLPSPISLQTTQSTVVVDFQISEMDTPEFESISTPLSKNENSGRLSFLSAGKIYMVDINGRNLEQVTNFPRAGDKYVEAFAWSRNGETLAYEIKEPLGGGYNAYQTFIYMTNIAGDNLFSLQSDYRDMYIVYQWDLSSDGTSIVFFDGDDNEVAGNDSGIFIMSSDDQNVRKLLDDRGWGQIVSMDWSPTNDKIVVEVSGTSPGNHFFVIGNDGATIEQLTPMEYPELPRNPKLSPQGDKIVFDSSQAPIGSPRSIYVMDSNGSNITRVVGDSSSFFQSEYPAWSPDGTKLAFVANDNNLYVVNINGTEPQKIIGSLSASISHIVWLP